MPINYYGALTDATHIRSYYSNAYLNNTTIIMPKFAFYCYTPVSSLVPSMASINDKVIT